MNINHSPRHQHRTSLKLRLRLLSALIILLSCRQGIQGQEDAVAPSEVQTMPNLETIMASFAEHEAAHQSFEMMVLEEYSKVIRFLETPFQWHEADQSSARQHSRFYYGQQNHQLWMSEEAVIAAPHVLLDTRRVVHSDGQTHSLSATQGVDSPDIDVQKNFRPLTGLFPLATKITRPQLLSDYYKADTSRVQLSWDGNLAKMTFTYDEEVDRPLRIDLWCHPDYNWFPVRMERYRHKDDQLFDSDWIVGTLEKSKDSVHIHAGICRYAQKVWVDGDNADAAPFMVVRFVVKAGEYGREIPEALFLPDLKRGTDRLLKVPSKDEIHTVNDGITQLLSAEAESESPKITILHLQHANAQEISETIERLYPERKPPIVVVNERTNSLLIRGDDATVREYRQLVEVLDADNSSSPQQSKPPGGTSSFGGGGFGGVRSARGAAGSSSAPAQSTTNNTVSPEEVPNDDTEQLKIFSLKFSNANDTSKIVQSLFGRASVKVATDERTNSLIVSGDAGSLSEIEAILLKLDSSETSASPSNPLAARNGGNSIVDPTPIAEYRERLDALEQPVQHLAEQVRAAEAKLGQDHADSAKLRDELRALVQKTFAARQEIQRAELAEFTRRLQRMQQTIETREKIAEKIVDRRMAELLDPEASWEPTLQSPKQGTKARLSNHNIPEPVGHIQYTETHPVYEPSEVSTSINRDELVASLNQKTAGLRNWKCRNASVQTDLLRFPLPQTLEGTVACSSAGQLRVACDNFWASMNIGLNKDTGWFYTKPGDSVFTTSWNTFVEAPRISESQGWVVPSPIWMMTLLGVQPLDPERFELQKPASGSADAWLVAMEEGDDGRLLRHIIKVDTVSRVILSHTLYDGDGKPLLVARLGMYKACGEFQLPHYLNLQFPTKNTFAVFKFADIETNADLPDALWQRPGNNPRMVEIDPGLAKEKLADLKTDDGQSTIDSPELSSGLPERFHGDWIVEQLIVKGDDVDLSALRNPSVKISADHFVIPLDGNIRETLAYTLLPGTPTKVDLIIEPTGSKALALGIVEITDNTFKLCFREPADAHDPPLIETDRPRTFGPESKMYFVQCRRIETVSVPAAGTNMDFDPMSPTLNRSDLLPTIDAILLNIEELQSRTPLKLLLQFKDEPLLQICDDFYKSVRSLRDTVEGNQPPAKLKESLDSSQFESKMLVAKFNRFKSQGMTNVLREIEDGLATLEIFIKSDQRVGVITNIVAGKNQVEVSVGLNDGITIGQQLTVATGNHVIGKVEIIAVEQDSSVAMILNVPADRPIRKGDRIQIADSESKNSADVVTEKAVPQEKNKRQFAPLPRPSNAETNDPPDADITRARAEEDGKQIRKRLADEEAAAKSARIRQPADIVKLMDVLGWESEAPGHTYLPRTAKAMEEQLRKSDRILVCGADRCHSFLIGEKTDRTQLAIALEKLVQSHPRIAVRAPDIESDRNLSLWTHSRELAISLSCAVIREIAKATPNESLSPQMPDQEIQEDFVPLAVDAPTITTVFDPDGGIIVGDPYAAGNLSGRFHVISVSNDLDKVRIGRIISDLVGLHKVKLFQSGDNVQIICSPRDAQTITFEILSDIHNSLSFQPPEPQAKAMNDVAFESAEVPDQTSPPESEAEKAIARMVLVFFQDEARRAVPGLMIDRGAETFVLTTGPATIVPDGVGQAKDRTFLEFPGAANVDAEFFVTKTADISFHRAKSGLTTFKLEKTIDLVIGDSLSAIIQSGKPYLRVTPKAARISAMDQATQFSIPTHKFHHEFSGLIQIDQRLPEGTPLFKNGQLAGITLLGTRFMKDDVPGSYVVPASRIVEVLQELKNE